MHCYLFIWKIETPIKLQEIIKKNPKNNEIYTQRRENITQCHDIVHKHKIIVNTRIKIKYDRKK